MELSWVFDHFPQSTNAIRIGVEEGVECNHLRGIDPRSSAHAQLSVADASFDTLPVQFIHVPRQSSGAGLIKDRDPLLPQLAAK